MRNYKKTELYSWQKEAESYFNLTPHPKKWFEFIGWITALSTLKFLSQKTNSVYINIIFWISLMVLFNYFSKMFWTKQFQKYLPVYLSKTHRRSLTYAISVIFVTAAYLLIGQLSDDISKALKP
jgi:amino acid transporter